MSTGYSRSSPSPRYHHLVEQYVEMHIHGEPFRQIAAEHTFSGGSLLRQCVVAIKKLIDEQSARTILDYGAGKGRQYEPLIVKTSDGRRFESVQEFWGVASITCYDPGYPPFRRLPQGPFDGVVCTDVLEHCPEDDLPWIMDEIFGFAGKFVFANVACYPALKHLANGENAHCTVQPPAWWDALVRQVAQRHPHVRYQFMLEHLAAEPGESKTSEVERLAG